MRLIKLTVENFRCYREPTSIRFTDLTALVGRNDVGKSTLMDALAIFFEAATPDKDDISKSSELQEFKITCEFDSLPDKLIVDTDFPTTLHNERLLSPTGTLIIRKTFAGATSKVKAVEAVAYHPNVEGYRDLLSLKKSELTARAAELGVDLTHVNKRVNAEIRQAIWNHCPNLQCAEISVPLQEEGGRQVWTALEPFLPTFALFKSDRASTDQDAEAQDPLKAAIREALKEVEPDLQKVRDFVEEQVRRIAEATVSKLREMDESVADTLHPVITTKRWETLFATSITGDEGIPLNKRGSGVKRLVLLNFFRAKAESKAEEKQSGSIIYAIEEPETSQHPRNQRLLLSALRDISSTDGRQVIFTTHTPMLARYIPTTDLRFIRKLEDGSRDILDGSPEIHHDIASSLGVLADHNVKIFIGVEGPNDISFLKGMAKLLRTRDKSLPDLEKLEVEGQLIFIPLGGSNMAQWASNLRHLNRPEFHLCDRDVPPPAPPKYADHIADINSRAGCHAVATDKREMENYIHHHAVIEAYRTDGINVAIPAPFGDFDDVPATVARAVHAAGSDDEWDQLPDKKREKKVSQAKVMLNRKAVEKMTLERLEETDPNHEILGWMTRIRDMMEHVH